MSFDFDFIAAIAAFKPLSRLRVAFDGANVYIPKTPIITALRNKHVPRAHGFTYARLNAFATSYTRGFARTRLCAIKIKESRDNGIKPHFYFIKYYMFLESRCQSIFLFLKHLSQKI